MIIGMRMRLGIIIAGCIAVFALSAFGQFDGAAFANDLRAKYGPPLAREMFTVRPGLEMTVNYAANGHVCRIELPPVAPGPDARVTGTHAIDEFLSELVPVAMRGKELMRSDQAFGAPSVRMVRYQNVTIGELFQGGKRTGVTVTFTKETCRDPTAR
jgi:hypothetical protein